MSETAADGDRRPRHAGKSAGLKVFLIACEESGDRLGALLMAAIEAAEPVTFCGIGGAAMTARGLDSLFGIGELAINGFAAIPARLPLILRRIREATAAVIAARPDVLVIIDSPDFTHRVARRVRRAAPHIPIVDYVSPTVWAWRPGRAAAMRRYVDHVLALLPFEPEAHRRLGGPPCTYVGHPLAEVVATLRPDAEEAARRAAAPPVLLVLPGSRGGEIARHLATFGAAIGLAGERLGASRDRTADGAASGRAGAPRHGGVANTTKDRRRAGAKVGRIPAGPRGAGGVRHGHARTCARPRADRDCLQSRRGGRADRPRAGAG